MTLHRSYFAALTVAVALASHANAQGDCKRPAPREFKQGETIMLSETKTFPCKVEFVNTSIALRGDADAAITDLGRQVARGPDGSFYTSAGRGAEIHVWSPTGQFKRAFGKAGQGPGEFANGIKSFAFGRDGRLFVADAPPNRRWSVFSPTLVFERSMAANATGNGTNDDGFLTDAGLYVSSADAVARTGNGFGVFDFAPNPQGQPRVVRQFGTMILRTPRIVTPSAGMNFWAAPREGPGAAYELELWRTDGTLLRTFRRDVLWFPKRDVGSEMEILSDDGTGIVLVGLMIPNAAKMEAVAKADPAQRRALQEAAIDIYFEAIDGNAGVVLASWGPFHPSTAMKTLPSGFIPRSRNGYRFESDSNGVSVARIVELRLVAN